MEYGTKNLDCGFGDIVVDIIYLVNNDYKYKVSNRDVI
jgi:hypothetical protein